MTITNAYVSSFTPLRGVVGGIMLGGAAALMLLGNGNIFGCSGITSSLFLRPKKTMFDASQQWKIVFMAVFVITSSILSIPYSGTDGGDGFSFVNDTRLIEDQYLPVPSWIAYLLGGFLVSFGTSIGSGCTTGHGICGMARLSPRSFVAVGTFMAFAMATSMLVSPTTSFAHAFAWLRTPNNDTWQFEPRQYIWLGWIVTGLITLWAAYTVFQSRRGGVEETQSATDPKTAPPVASASTPVKSTTASSTTYGSGNGMVASPSRVTIPEGCDGENCSNSDDEVYSETDHTGNESANKQDVDESAPEASVDDVMPVNHAKQLLIASLAGVLFSVGLAVSGMNLQSKNFGFLTLTLIPHGEWDPTLLCVMASACATSFVSYQFLPQYALFAVPESKQISCPYAGGKFDIPNKRQIDLPLVGGGALFGIGWGIAGFCPGPSLFMTAAGIQSLVYCYMPAYIIGGYAANYVKERFIS